MSPNNTAALVRAKAKRQKIAGVDNVLTFEFDVIKSQKKSEL